MKNVMLMLIGLLGFGAFAQADFDNMVEAEMKSAYNLSNFTMNENTANYDVTHHTLEFTVDPSVQFITGTVTTTFTALENMASVTFELSNNLTVSTVTQNGNGLSFVQNSNNELVITLPATLTAGASATVVISYSGAPMDEEDSFVAGEHNGIPVLWTLSEPYGAKEWWPCKQDLNDKIESLDVYITAPWQYISVSNGVEQSQQLNGNGTKTTHFHHSYPIPAYLVAIAVTNYTVYNQVAGTAPNTFPIVNYLYPETATENEAIIDQTPNIMAFFEDTFEAYPFNAEKYGHAQCGFGGGMEHTTVSFMGYFARDIIAHELAHQWFGDKITCGSWQDIWLNEGFATYLAALVLEDMDGAEAFTTWRAQRVWNITFEPDGSVYVPEEDVLNVSRVFSSRLTYYKGAMVLHMLRFRLGQEVFYQAVRNYLADSSLAYAYAKTPDFKAHLEAESGMDLTEFFNDWVYGEGYPIYNAQVTYTGNMQVQVVLTQTQSNASVSFFEGPVPVRFYSPEGEMFETVLNNTFNGQTFTVNVPFEILDVQVNATYDIITGFNTSNLQTDALSLEGLILYPNPSGNVLNLQVPAKVSVQKTVFYNTLGQEVLNSGAETSWNVSGLANGVYVVSVTTNAGTASLKFVKQ